MLELEDDDDFNTKYDECNIDDAKFDHGQEVLLKISWNYPNGSIMGSTTKIQQMNSIQHEMVQSPRLVDAMGAKLTKPLLMPRIQKLLNSNEWSHRHAAPRRAHWS